MRNVRLLELSVIIALVAFGIATKRSMDKGDVTTHVAGQIVPTVPILNPRIPLSESSVCFRWSSRGGCFNTADFFFELRGREDGGADWRGLVCSYGSLIERTDGSNPSRGNYQASGTLDPGKTWALFLNLETAGVWELGPDELYHTGSQETLLVRLGGRSHKVAAFQSSFESNDTVGTRVNGVLFEGLPGQVSHELYQRVEREEPPDGPLFVPDILSRWPSDTASLFLIPW